MSLLQVSGGGVELIEGGHKLVLPSPNINQMTPEYIASFAIVLQLDRLIRMFEDAQAKAAAAPSQAFSIEDAMKQATDLMVRAGVPAEHLASLGGMFAGVNTPAETPSNGAAKT